MNEAQRLVDAADTLQAGGKANEAIALYRQALRVDPHRIDAQNNLGNVFLALGQYPSAARCYSAALKVQPDDARIHCNLANAQRRLGLLNEAIASTQRSIALEPTLSMAHNILGLCRAALGQRDAAVASYRQSLALNPQYVDALNNLGDVLRDLGRHPEARPLYARAIELEPGRPDSHCNLGNLLLETGHPNAAATSFQRALALDPKNARANLCLATVLRRQGRAAEAEARCLTVLTNDPTCVDALFILGELHADQGHFPQAVDLFQRVLRLNPSFSAALCGIATLSDMSGADPAWLQGVNTLLAQHPPLRQEIGLRYALGKYHDDLKQYAPAFEQYHQANELSKRCTPPYDSTSLTRHVDEIIHHINTRFLQKCQNLGSDTALPIFIVGMPRSGTSLTEQILASHPSVSGAGELTFWHDAFVAYQKATQTARSSYRAASPTAQAAPDSVRPASPNSQSTPGAYHPASPTAQVATGPSRTPSPNLPPTVGAHRPASPTTQSTAGAHPATSPTAQSASGSHRPAIPTPAELIARFASDYLQRLTQLAHRAPRAIDKMPANFLYLGLIHAAFPNAKIIHIQRHPIDTCLSMYFQNFMDMGPYANDLHHLAHYYRQYQRIMEHWRAILPTTALLEISYETLIEDQQGTTRQLLDFLHLPWDPSCLDFHNTHRRVITASQWQVRQKIHSESIGRWRHYAKFVQPLQGLANSNTNRARHGATQAPPSALRSTDITHPQLM